MQTYSTVLYLGDSGGPTVVLGQTPSAALAQEAWLCWPQANSLLCYPGDLLHGVIPGQGTSHDSVLLRLLALPRSPDSHRVIRLALRHIVLWRGSNQLGPGIHRVLQASADAAASLAVALTAVMAGSWQ